MHAFPFSNHTISLIVPTNGLLNMEVTIASKLILYTHVAIISYALSIVTKTHNSRAFLTLSALCLR